MGKIDKFQVWQDTFDQIYKINSFLNKIDSSSASDIKKAESILKKVSSVAQKDKKLAAFFYQTSGIVEFSKKDFKSALDFFKKAVEKSEGSSGEPYVWLSYVHLQLGKEQDCFK